MSSKTRIIDNADHWSVTPIRQLMHPPALIPSETTLEEAVNQLQNQQAHCLLVQNQSGGLLGMFTEEVILEKVIGQNTRGSEPVAQFVEKNFFSIHQDSSMAKVIDVMGLRRLRYLPLVDDQGLPRGLFSIRGLINYMASKISLVNGGEKTRVEGSSNRAFGDLQSAITEVLNLPISFALSSRGYKKVVQLSKGELVQAALKKLRGSGNLAALVLDGSKLVGLCRVRDIPFKFLHNNEFNIPVQQMMINLPQTVVGHESLGYGIQQMSQAGVMFLHYKNTDEADSLISEIGLISYLYDHIYEDQ